MIDSAADIGRKDSASLWAGHIDSVQKYILGTTIGTHVGPGVVGVAFFENKGNK